MLSNRHPNAFAHLRRLKTAKEGLRGELFFSLPDAKARGKSLFKPVIHHISLVTVVDATNMQIRTLTQALGTYCVIRQITNTQD